MNTIDINVDKDGIATLTIDVKDRPMNVMTPGFLQDLAEAANRIATDDRIKGAVFASGKDSFMAGADLIGIVDSFDERKDAAEVYGWCRELNQLLRKLETCGKPVFLAGGLNAENVREAVETVEPFGLDLCSGVRTCGKLDLRKLEAFFNAVNR